MAATLRGIASVKPIVTMPLISHEGGQRIVDVDADVQGRDLGSVARDIQHAIDALSPLPPNVKVRLRGQSESMFDAFRTLGLGLLLSAVFVYLLMVVLFQSWADPFIVMTALPGALSGVALALLVTRTTLNVESFMGAIMAVGVAVSNSILLVHSANDLRLRRGLSAVEGVVEAGRTRLRPVLMTALAMIFGMIPTAVGLGDGGDQNAPLGRAVIGGLLVASLVTLFVVPIVYSLVRRATPAIGRADNRFRAEMEPAAATVEVSP